MNMRVDDRDSVDAGAEFFRALRPAGSGALRGRKGPSLHPGSPCASTLGAAAATLLEDAVTKVAAAAAMPRNVRRVTSLLLYISSSRISHPLLPDENPRSGCADDSTEKFNGKPVNP